MDCIDCAADASVVNAVNEGINAAQSISTINRPWVMISVNDDQQDLHFRKAGTLLTVPVLLLLFLTAQLSRHDQVIPYKS